MMLRRARNDNDKAGGFGESRCADDEREMRAGQFTAGRWGKVQMNDITPVGVVSLLAQISSLPERPGTRSGPHMDGVTPLSNSSSVHFRRLFARRMVMVSPLTRTVTEWPSFNSSRSTPSRGMRSPRLLPQRATLLVFSIIPEAMFISNKDILSIHTYRLLIEGDFRFAGSP